MTDHVLTPPRPASDEPVPGAAAYGVSIVTPDDADWDAARRPWNVSIDLRPAAVAVPRTVEEVRAAVAFARERGLRIVPISTGHNAAPHGDLSDAVLLRMHEMRGVAVSAETRTARVQGGAVWGDVTEAAAPYGFVALSGSAVDVGVVGYLTGGGLSWLARKHGLAANHVLAFDVVTADGELRHVDADHEPDLFWALRGGGGSFGVVVGVTLQLFEVRTVYAGSLFFPLERFAEVVTAYDAWVDTLPDSATVCVRALRVPPLAHIPDALRGKAFVVVNGAVLESDEVAARLVEPIRALGPVIDDWARMPASELWQIHMEPPGPVPARGDGLVIDSLPAEAISALDEAVGAASGSPLLVVELRALGGALAAPPSGGGAVSHLPGRYCVYAVGITPDPESVAAVEEHVRAVRDVLGPWAAQRHYLNLTDTPGSASRFHDPVTLASMRSVRDRYDPAGVLSANHRIDR